MNLPELTSRLPSNRVDELRRRMDRAGLDAYWVVRGANVRYLSGFTGEESTLLVGTDRTVLITDSRYEEQARAEARVEEVEVRTGAMTPTVAGLVEALGLRRVGFTASELSYADWKALSRRLRGAEAEPDRGGCLAAMRARKCPTEVEAIGRAVRLSERAFERFAEELTPGRSERWLAGRLEWAMKELGAEGAAFEVICAIDEGSSRPHAGQTGRELGPESTVLVDWGARLEGYNSDLTRILGVGTMPNWILEPLELVLRAREAALGRLEAGVSCAEVDRAARKVIAAAGGGSCFGHALGHGVGLEVHEGPRLAAGEDQVLLPGMVVTVEPGIYLPGEGGVRIEEMAVVTTTGHQLLSSLPRHPWADAG